MKNPDTIDNIDTEELEQVSGGHRYAFSRGFYGFRGAPLLGYAPITPFVYPAYQPSIMPAFVASWALRRRRGW